MALKKAPFLTRDNNVTNPLQSGPLHRRYIKLDVSKGVANGDIIEVAGLPAHAQPVGCTVWADNVTAALDVGPLDGEFASEDQSRSISTAWFTGQNPANETAAAAKDVIVTPPVQQPTGIGIKFGAAVAAGAGKMVHLFVEYIAA